MANLIERHREKFVGALSCFDRLVLQGTLPSVAYPQAVTTELDRRDIRLFDHAKQFALPFRDAIRARTEQLAAEEGVEIEYIQRMKTFRKEDRIQQILAARGNRPRLVHIFSAMEPCPTYEPWHDKKSGCTFIRRDRGKCLHYYFYASALSQVGSESVGSVGSGYRLNAATPRAGHSSHRCVTC